MSDLLLDVSSLRRSPGFLRHRGDRDAVFAHSKHQAE
jgi:hypothetical protein